MPRPKLQTENTPEALAPTKPGGRRRIQLRKKEREELLEQQLTEAAAALFLDLDQPRQWHEIANELGISVEKLKNLTRTELFEQLYTDKFAELGHDPRYRIGQAALMDLVPQAVKELRNLITQASTPPSVRMQAIRYLLDVSGLKVAPQNDEDERKELAEFLKSKPETVNQLNIGTVNISAEYKEEAIKWGLVPEDVPLEGVFISATEQPLQDAPDD